MDNEKNICPECGGEMTDLEKEDYGMCGPCVDDKLDAEKHVRKTRI